MKDHFQDKDQLVTIYIGDDQTDEDAFSVLKDSRDISVLVSAGNQESQANYFLADVEAVNKFLKRLLEM